MTAPLAYPAELTDELRDVLSLMPWVTGPLAHSLRRWGDEDIPARAEAEQAHVLHWLTTLVLAHGPGWRDVAEARIAALRERAGEAPVAPVSAPNWSPGP